MGLQMTNDLMTWFKKIPEYHSVWLQKLSLFTFLVYFFSPRRDHPPGRRKCKSNQDMPLRPCRLDGEGQSLWTGLHQAYAQVMNSFFLSNSSHSGLDPKKVQLRQKPHTIWPKYLLKFFICLFLSCTIFPFLEHCVLLVTRYNWVWWEK